ncbi:MAG: hypothetical protein IJ390_01495 [Lachnospiraceae bacterium]|nr:hypothetical protein [Lachnospiraceae bacterium]
MKEKIFDKKWNVLLMTAFFAAALLLSAVHVNAAGQGSIDIRKDAVAVKIGETASVEVCYSDVTGGFSDLAAISGDESLAAVSLTEKEDGKAVVNVAGAGMGTTVVAVYRISNPNIVDYLTVRCNMAEKGEVYTVQEGEELLTMYEDILIYYGYTMKGNASDQLAVNALTIERSTGIDSLHVKGTLMQEGESSGFHTFYASFYDAAGKLLERQAYYSRDPVSGSTLELKWYIPEGCTKIVLE